MQVWWQVRDGGLVRHEVYWQVWCPNPWANTEAIPEAGACASCGHTGGLSCYVNFPSCLLLHLSKTSFNNLSDKIHCYCSLILRYDSTIGVFTVPPGGDGVYYFSAYVLVQYGESGWFDMTLNDDVICSTYPDHNNNVYAPGSCSAVVHVTSGPILEQFKSF